MSSLKPSLLLLIKLHLIAKLKKTSIIQFENAFNKISFSLLSVQETCKFKGAYMRQWPGMG